ncbi:tyrosine-type recombinase/integrase [Shewanella sp. A14]
MSDTKLSTFSQWNDYYLDDCCASGQSLRTVRIKRCNLALFERWALAEDIMSPLQVTKKVLESYKRHLNTYINPRTNEVLALGTRRNRLTAVKTMYKRMVYLEVIDINPLEVFELPKVPKSLPTAFLTFEELEQVFAQTMMGGLNGLRDRAILETYYASGIRRMELGNLEIGDINFETKKLRVNNGKGAKDRIVPIAKRTCEWIQQYLKHSRPTLRNMRSGKVLFLSNSGLKFGETQLSELAKKYLLMAGFNVNAACNVFRHSAATHMLEGGADIRQIQVYLGHADISTTMVYTHVTNPELERAYEKSHPAAR